MRSKSTVTPVAAARRKPSPAPKMAPMTPMPRMISSGEVTAFVIACVFMRRQLFSILSRPMNMEFRVMNIAWPSKYSDVKRMRKPIPGLLRSHVAMVSERSRRARERSMEKVILKVIPALIRARTLRFFPSEWKRAENLVRAGEIPMSLRVMRREGAIIATAYRP